MSALTFQETARILLEFQKTYGNGYMNMSHVGHLNSLYVAAVGFTLFFATIKFIRLLRFNNRFFYIRVKAMNV